MEEIDHRIFICSCQNIVNTSFFTELTVDFDFCCFHCKKSIVYNKASKLSEEHGNLYFNIALMFSLYTCVLLISPGKNDN